MTPEQRLREMAESEMHEQNHPEVHSALLAGAEAIGRMEAIDKILHGKLDDRPNAPCLSVLIDQDGSVLVMDNDYEPSKYIGRGETFSEAMGNVTAALAAKGE